MQLYRLENLGNIESVSPHDEPKPTPGHGEVLIEVKANSVNFRDIKLVLGQYPVAMKPRVIPLSDASGLVAEVGPGVAGLKVGDRVVNAFYPTWQGGPTTKGQESYGADSDGWLTAFKVVRAEAVLPMPSHLTFEEAATLPCAAVTAWNALAGIRPGETVLTQGSGGVSTFAIQFAKAVGARVISTSSSDPERLKKLGSDLVINTLDLPEWAQVVQDATKGVGVDRIVEVGGPGTLAQSIKAVAYGGEIVIVGARAAKGGEPGIEFASLFASQAKLRCVGVGSRSDMAAMLKAVETAKIHPVIEIVYPFSEARKALDHYVNRRVFGKVVIRH